MLLLINSHKNLATMGLFQSKTEQDSIRTSLKLEAQKVKEFSGAYDEWQCWKSQTKCALDGNGYKKILVDPGYAKDNPRMNQVVYS